MLNILYFSLRRHLIKLILGDDQIYYIGLGDKHESIIVSIAPEDKDVPMNTVSFQERWDLINFIRTSLSELVGVFMKASHPPEPYMPCTRCYEPHITLDDVVSSKKILHCHDSTKLTMEYYDGLRLCKGIAVECGNFIVPVCMCQ